MQRAEALGARVVMLPQLHEASTRRACWNASA